MAFLLSPGVNVSEIDLTTIIPAVSVSKAAYVGDFVWGQVEDAKLISSEKELVDSFGKPNDDHFLSFFTAASFLAYASNLWLVRVVGTGAKNAVATGTAVLIKNDADYLNNYAGGEAAVGPTAAKYPGLIGDSLRVSICPSADAYSKLWTNATSVAEVVTLGTPPDYTTIAVVGSKVIKVATGEEKTIVSVDADDGITLDSAFAADLDDEDIKINWQYKTAIQFTPGTTDYALSRGGLNDEMNIIVIDEDGKFTGVAGSILERFPLCSKAFDAKFEDGASAYYKDVLNNRSKYVRWMDHPTGTTNWGDEAALSDFTGDIIPFSYSLAGGLDGSDITDGEKMLGYDLFGNAEQIDISLVIGGEASATVAVHIINNICESRKDCVALLSPPKDTVVDNAGDEAEDIVTFRDNLPSSSYAMLDSGWKLMYDKYNDDFRYVPLSGDIAGLCARTDTDRDPWFSPAGLNRGNIKNVVRLSYNPDHDDRDLLYPSGINPVVTFPGQGTVLFGDKTLLAKPSAFDRINVRRLFIVLEKAIAIAARYSLFELNDDITRSQFRNMVNPFLRDVQGRRGIFDFRVVCDSSNNTPEVIDSNRFVGDIYIKPARSINFIQLNFVAVRTGVAFEEVVGKF